MVPYQECGPLLCRVPSPYGANRVAAPQDKTAGSKEMAEAARGGAHMDPEPVHLVVSGYVDEVPQGGGGFAVFPGSCGILTLTPPIPLLRLISPARAAAQTASHTAVHQHRQQHMQQQQQHTQQQQEQQPQQQQSGGRCAVGTAWCRARR